MSCRQVFCDECSTKIDGINTCLACLKKKAKGDVKKAGWFVKSLNAIFGWSSLVAMAIALASFIFWIGMAIPNSNSVSFGNRIFVNKRVLESLGDSMRQFNADVGRYPSADEGFKALEWERYPQSMGAPPKGYSSSGYWPSGWDVVVDKKGELALDKYQHPLRYIYSPGMPFPIIVSGGPDGVIETDAKALTKQFQNSTGKKVHIYPIGDDQICILD